MPAMISEESLFVGCDMWMRREGQTGGRRGIKLTAGVARGAGCEPSKLTCAAAVTEAEGLGSLSLAGSCSTGQMLLLGALQGDRPLLTLVHVGARDRRTGVMFGGANESRTAKDCVEAIFARTVTTFAG